MQKNRVCAILFWLAVLLWASIIFLSSAQPATVSGANSKGIVSTVIKMGERFEIFKSGMSDNQELLLRWDHYLRKFTHSVVYLILSILVTNALKRSGFNQRRLYVVSFVICVLYASSDEFHQLFVQGRGAQIKDVIIDSFGSGVGLVIYWLVSAKNKIPKWQ